MPHELADPDALSDLEARVADAVSIEEPWALLERFSELERVSGTAEEERAAEYITDRLDAFGVEYERYDPELYISQPHDAAVRVPGRDIEPAPVKTVSFAAADTVSAPVEYVGEPGQSTLGSVEEEEASHVPYEDVGDLSGTIALTAPGTFSIRAMGILEEKGAVGVIGIHHHDREPHDGIATPIWGGAPTLEEKEAGRLPDIPIVNVTRPDGEALRGAAESDAGLEVELETDVTTGWFECPVVVAEIEGGASDNDDFVLLHGHYDSWAVGITDNATGDAGLLECARVFEAHADELERDLRVAWWPAHSTGRYAGSAWYAETFAHDLAERCVAQVNMDSPGAADTTEYTDMSCWTPEAHPLVGTTIEDVAGAPYAEHHPHRAGDYSFDNLGITGFFMLSSNIPAEVREERGYHQVGGCGGNSDAWHLSTDTLDKAGKDELHRDIRVYAVSVLRVLTADVLPFDHARNAAHLIEVIEGYDETAGEAFDFGPTLEALRALKDDIETFQAAADNGELDPAVADETIKTLSRTLTRLNLVRDGQFEQDPATSRQPVPRYAPAARFPSLEGDDRRFLAVQLRREQNDVVYELRRARELIPAV